MRKILLLICFITPFSFAQEIVSEVVKIMDKEPHYANPKHSRVTLLMPSSFDLGYSVECTYYKVAKPDSEVVASTNHIAMKVTPEWTVKTPMKNIDFVICKGVKK